MIYIGGYKILIEVGKAEQPNNCVIEHEQPESHFLQLSIVQNSRGS